MGVVRYFPRAWVSLLALALAAVWSPAPAAARQGTGALTELEAIRLGAASRIRLELFRGDVVEGRLTAITNDLFLLRDGRNVPISDVAVAHALHPRTGALALRGGLLGTGLGLALAVTTGDPDDRVLAAEVGVVAGLVGGAALGALIGSRRFAADTVYAAPAPTAQARPTGLLDYRVGGTRGAIRTNVAITPFVGSASYSDRTRTRTEGDDGVGYGLSQTQEVGLMLQYALGPRAVVRAGASALRGNPRTGNPGSSVTILSTGHWLTRGELGVEFRMRSNVPGYFVLVADALNNPKGYVIGLLDEEGRVGTLGVDAGLLPRVGIGIGYDIFGDNDRRLRFEWIYRLGRYNHPEIGDAYVSSRITRDSSLTLGMHWPLLRPR